MDGPSRGVCEASRQIDQPGFKGKHSQGPVCEGERRAGATTEALWLSRTNFIDQTDYTTSGRRAAVVGQSLVGNWPPMGFS